MTIRSKILVYGISLISAIGGILKILLYFYSVVPEDSDRISVLSSHAARIPRLSTYGDTDAGADSPGPEAETRERALARCRSGLCDLPHVSPAPIDDKDNRDLGRLAVRKSPV